MSKCDAAAAAGKTEADHTCPFYVLLLRTLLNLHSEHKQHDSLCSQRPSAGDQLPSAEHTLTNLPLKPSLHAVLHWLPAAWPAQVYGQAAMLAAGSAVGVPWHVTARQQHGRNTQHVSVNCAETRITVLPAMCISLGMSRPHAISQVLKQTGGTAISDATCCAQL
jgi:hypothetical protein